MKEEGIVVSVEKDALVIETVPHKECNGCKTCGAGGSRRVVVGEDHEDFKEGDRVEIEIDPSVMLKLYMLLYGAPLLAFILSILMAYSALKKPALSAAIAIICTGVTYLGVGKYIKRKNEFSPKIIKREEI